MGQVSWRRIIYHPSGGQDRSMEAIYRKRSPVYKDLIWRLRKRKERVPRTQKIVEPCLCISVNPHQRGRKNIIQSYLTPVRFVSSYLL